MVSEIEGIVLAPWWGKLMSYVDRITAPGPKKLLSLDGGGIRGMLTVEVLDRMEEQLRRALGRGPDFVLADYFDYIGGTSTGAIIAAALSYGMSTSKLREFYLKEGGKMFDPAAFWKKIKYRYEDDELANALKREFGAETTFGSDRLRTLLMVVLRNATTDSPWPLSNNPGAKYNARDRDDCNLNFPLWQVVRASTAAPTYFPPEEIQVAKRRFIFVDGGVTTYNNPAFLLFLMATLKHYGLGWEPGQDQMLLVSVGTGTAPDANANLGPDDMNLLYNASRIPSALMFAALNEQDMLCRAFGKCLVGEDLDRELRDLKGHTGPLDRKLFTYMRYNAELTVGGLRRLTPELADIRPRNVQKMDSTEHVEDLMRVGRAVADKYVRIEHFEGFLDT